MNSNKIPAQLQGLMLKSQLFGRAIDLCKKVDDAVVQSDGGATAIARAIYKCDPLSVINETFQKFAAILNACRGNQESFYNFESRFDAAVSSYHAAAPNSKLPESLVAFLLINNANLDDNQRISILSASAPKIESNQITESNTLLEKITYEEVASIVRSFDKPKHNAQNQNNFGNQGVKPLSANSARNNNRKFGKAKRKLTREQIAEMKKTSKCKDCNKVGHWSGDPECEDGKESNADASCPKNNSDSSKARSITFGMVQLGDDAEADNTLVLVDDGAPYSGLGQEEVKEVQSKIMPGWNGILDPLPDSVCHRPYWQYGRGKHASKPKRILGSVLLAITSDQGTPLQIRHLVIEGSSPWIIGRNVTSHGNIIHVDGNYLQFYNQSTEEEITLRLVDQDMHSYIQRDRFYHPSFRSVCDPIFASLCCFSTNLNWKETKAVINRVHEHVCGHSNYNDISLLLKRNKIWDDSCSKYLSLILETCPNCHVIDAPSGNRPVSLSAMSREFNDVVTVDHLHLDGLTVLHCMDAATRYSAGAVVESTKMEECNECFETCWVSPFWAPGAVQGDKAFKNSIFQEHLNLLGTTFRPVPPRRHHKNALESKHRIIRDIFTRIRQANPNVSLKILAVQAIRISNDLYGNDVASANELAKGYTRPLSHGAVVTLPQDIRAAHDELIAKRKLNTILRSNAVRDKPVKVGDIVNIFVKHDNQKRGTWSPAKPVLKFDTASKTVTVPGSRGKYIDAAIEDVRHAIHDVNDLAIAIQEAIDACESSIADAIDDVSTHEDDTSNSESTDADAPPSNADDTTECDDLDYYKDLQLSVPSAQQTNEHETQEHDHESEADPLTYYPGSGGTQPTHGMQLREREPIVYSAGIELQPGTSLSSSEQQDLQLYAERFKGKEFLLNQAEGLPTHITHNAYTHEEESFLSTCEKVHISKVPSIANVIASHVLYTIKDLDDGNKLCKARIAPHGNKDREKHTLRTDSAACPPLGFRILLSICTMLNFYVSKVDIKSAFLQSGKAARNVYVIPPKECTERMFYWLLQVAIYGLVNANAKWQHHSDTTFLDMGLTAAVFIPQLFYLKKDGVLVLLVAKIIDDILIGGRYDIRRRFIQRLSEVYKLGTIVHLPGSFKFFGLSIEQDEDYTVRISAEDKLMGITPYTLTRMRRNNTEDPLNAVEKYAFQSVNGSLSFLGITVSPFAAFAASHLQQTSSGPTVHDIVRQINVLKTVQRIGTRSTYCLRSSGTHEVSIVLFADAARPNDNGQLSYIGGLMIGPLCQGSVLHTITWASHRSKRPVKSIASAEVLAAGDAIEEGKLLSQLYSKMLGIEVHLFVVVDSKDLFDSLSTCRTPEDKMIRADVQLLRYNFETHQLNKLVWIPGSANPADVLTKRDSPLTETLQLMLFNGTIPLQLGSSQSRSSNALLG